MRLFNWRRQAVLNAMPLVKPDQVRTPWHEFWRRFRRQHMAMTAALFVILLIVVAIFARWIAPYDAENYFDYDNLNNGPSLQHWFGVDSLGRDIFSRVLVGAQISLAAGVFAVFIGAAIGTLLGLLAGYYEGWWDRLIMRICDVLFAFPGILLAIAVVAVLGSGIANVIIAVAIFSIPAFARLVRGNTLVLKQQTFIAGFSAGAGAKAGSIGYSETLSPTLKGTAGGNCMPSVLCLNDQGGRVMDCTEDVTGTLRAQEHGHQPLVYENHGIDARYTGPHTVAPTLSARAGTGGNNLPLVEQKTPEVFCITGNAIDRKPLNGGNGIGYQEDIAFTLTATDRHAICGSYQDTVGALCRGDEKGVGNQYVSQDKLILSSGKPDNCTEKAPRLIRRLTPLECERLQGFPDGWTDLPVASDSARYKALGNSVAIPCVEFIMWGICAAVLYG